MLVLISRHKLQKRSNFPKLAPTQSSPPLILCGYSFILMALVLFIENQETEEDLKQLCVILLIAYTLIVFVLMSLTYPIIF